MQQIQSLQETHDAKIKSLQTILSTQQQASGLDFSKNLLMCESFRHGPIRVNDQQFEPRHEGEVCQERGTYRVQTKTAARKILELRGQL